MDTAERLLRRIEQLLDIVATDRNSARSNEAFDAARDLIARHLSRPEPQEEFYKKLWKDFVSIQRGDMLGVIEKVERYYREHPEPSGETPETNAASFLTTHGSNAQFQAVQSDFARSLERRLAQREDEIAELKKWINSANIEWGKLGGMKK